MLKPILLVSAAALLAFAAATAPGNLAQAPAAGGKGAAKPTGSSEPLGRAKKIYAVDCAVCHGDNGNGQTDLAKSMELKLGDWTDPKTLSDKQDADLFKVIRDGKDKMPPEDAGRAKDDEIKSLILYIREFGKAQQASAGTGSAQ